jgi:hypothetical protein
MLLLVNIGRGLAVFCTFWVCESGNFLAVEPGWAIETVLLGVVAGVVTLALTLLLGAVMESLPTVPNRLGVAGMLRLVPSLVVGLLPLLDMADAGRSGGGMLLSALKKLDLRRPLVTAGDEGSWLRLSMVRSESEGRDFFFAALPRSASTSTAISDSESSS